LGKAFYTGPVHYKSLRLGRSHS